MLVAVPEVAKVTSYTTMELNGWVYLWHHAEGAEPSWTPVELQDITSGTWQYKGRTEHYINDHIEVRLGDGLSHPVFAKQFLDLF